MSTKNLCRWSGIASILAGGLIVLATVVHPARESPELILQQQARLIAGHWLFTLFCGFFLLGLTGLYIAESERAGRLGLVSFLILFFGTLFFAISNDYGFIAPLLAAQAPAMLNAINLYPPEVALNTLLFLGFFVGFVIFGIAVQRAGVLPRPIGVLLVIGPPLFLAGSLLSILYLDTFWLIAILGGLLLGSGLAWAGYLLWSNKEPVTV